MKTEQTLIQNPDVVNDLEKGSYEDDQQHCNKVRPKSQFSIFSHDRRPGSKNFEQISEGTTDMNPKSDLKIRFTDMEFQVPERPHRNKNTEFTKSTRRAPLQRSKTEQQNRLNDVESLQDEAMVLSERQCTTSNNQLVLNTPSTFVVHKLPDLERLEADILVYRCIKTACHELGHIFGLTHCSFYECLMNGSNLVEEADKKPFILCPVCLRKIAVYL